MFLHSTFYWLVGWLVYVGKVVGTVVHLGGDLVLGLSEMHGPPAGGCRACNVR